jgi:branched-chain amino acid transport system ATP-binding protein
MELLRFMGIDSRANDVARILPYGYQRRLEIARAMATGPTLLCLDEPAAGLNPA